VAESLASAVTSGRRLAGTVLTLPGATAAELLAEPFDLVWVDLEHGALGALDAQEMIIGAQAAGTFALVRLPSDAHRLMAAMLDAGADGVVLADVAHPATAEAATARVAHPPDGTRGWGPRRLTLRQRGTGRRPPRPSVWVQIESAEGVRRVEQIAAVPGIDAVVVGTADLSFSLGAPLDAHAPQLLHAVETVRRATRAAGVALGVAGALDAAPPAAYAGASILVHSTDARLCAGAVDGAAAWLRGVLESDRGAAVS
jgi:4-hydroxy-2-oxoheptanedioate aldolase